MKSFKQLIKESYSYSSLQVRIPFDVSQRIFRVADEIPDNILAPDGREKRPHITIKYGILSSDPDVIKNIPLPKKITATLGKTTLFKNEHKDVLIIKVKSPDLVKLNTLVKKHIECIDTYPVYEPHATIAYLKPGTGERYNNTSSFDGITLEFTELEFSPKGNNIYISIPLEGNTNETI